MNFNLFRSECFIFSTLFDIKFFFFFLLCSLFLFKATLAICNNEKYCGKASKVCRNKSMSFFTVKHNHEQLGENYQRDLPHSKTLASSRWSRLWSSSTRTRGWWSWYWWTRWSRTLWRTSCYCRQEFVASGDFS